MWTQAVNSRYRNRKRIATWRRVATTGEEFTAEAPGRRIAETERNPWVPLPISAPRGFGSAHEPALEGAALSAPRFRWTRSRRSVTLHSASGGGGGAWDRG